MTWASSKLPRSRPGRLNSDADPPTPIPEGRTGPLRRWEQRSGESSRPVSLGAVPGPGIRAPACGATMPTHSSHHLGDEPRGCLPQGPSLPGPRPHCRAGHRVPAGRARPTPRAAQPGPARGGPPTRERCRAGVTGAGAGRLLGDHAALSASHKVPSPRRAEWSWPCSWRVNTKQAPLDPALGQSVPPGPHGQGLAALLAAPGRGSSKQLLRRQGMGGPGQEG